VFPAVKPIGPFLYSLLGVDMGRQETLHTRDNNNESCGAPAFTVLPVDHWLPGDERHSCCISNRQLLRNRCCVLVTPSRASYVAVYDACSTSSDQRQVVYRPGL